MSARGGRAACRASGKVGTSLVLHLARVLLDSTAMIVHPTRQRRGSSSLALWTIVASVSALALVGAGLSLGSLGARHRPAATFIVGQDVPTSFGVMAVEGVRAVGADDVRHAAQHGADTPNLADQVQVSVTITNLTDKVVAYSPDQFRLVHSGNPSAAPDSATTLRAGTLQPSAHIDGQMSFATPGTGDLELTFRDPGGSRPSVVDLGSPEVQTTPGAQHQH